ncbi:PadR family transcriptional regulator [Wansuia hejianensis]|uniref:PadR family transcriptional regulator n=1 Tax=Wansuia hejianensis TaxID=2763667 RepID=A0A926EX21_9FIRM|nr:PadR family transcriptional regulator [Wansuia hejianensis]MBC8590531.1 PadR family transcriptional regulator [Wansuia hejianensis]
MSLYKGERQRQFPTTIGTTAFVKLYILHLLNEKDYYGNKLKDEISRRLNNKWSPSPGMIYPLLRELESEGYIQGHWEEPQKRTIRRYKITDSGIKHYDIILRQYRSSFDDSLFIIKTVLKDIYKEKI